MDEFLTYLRAERRYSELTVKAYGDDIRRFARFCTRDGAEPFDPARVIGRRSAGLDRLARRHGKNGGTEHQPENLVGKGLFRYLRKQRIVESDLFAHITALKTPQRLPVVRRRKPGCSASSIADATIRRFFYGTGRRRGAVVLRDWHPSCRTDRYTDGRFLGRIPDVEGEGQRR